MPTYLLTWNPKKSPLDIDFLVQGSKNLAAGKEFTGRWSAGNTQSIKPGDRVFLLRQRRRQPGLIGSGIILKGSYLGPHWDAKKRRAGKRALFVEVNWHDMVPNHELSRAELLKGILPATLLKVASSGVQIPPALCDRLQAHWTAHLASLHQPSGTVVTVNPYSDPTAIANAAQFKSALLTVNQKEGINPKQKAMLCAHYQAPAHIITAQILAHVAHYRSHGAANIQYGRLAHRLADALHYKPGLFPDGKPHWWRALANGNEGDPHNEDGHYEWILRPELVAALQELKWFSPPATPNPSAISPLTFNRQFERFKTRIRHLSKEQPFTSFRDGLPAEMEDYKENVRNEALRLLGCAKWKSRDVGTGLILKRVIQAIEIFDPSRDLRNNLVAWQNRFGHKQRSHRAILDARKKAATRRLFEQWFLDFFQNHLEEGKAFEQFCRLAGTRYDLIAYLFFLKDWNRFMPIAPTTFDEAFKLLGMDLVTAHHCSWENYLNYNAVLLDVQRLLHEVAEVADARLIDAHSFCWMLARVELPGAVPASTIPLPRAITNLQSVAPQVAKSNATSDYAIVTEEQFSERDQRRRRLGKLAQDVALQSEQRRLRELGHLNPKQVVQPVWDEPSRHYDILSCELDGSPRHIEVKSTRKAGDKLSFFLSIYEWEQSRTMPNYWFYLVLEAESVRPDVVMIAANNLSADFLAPVSYQASFRAPQS